MSPLGLHLSSCEDNVSFKNNCILDRCNSHTKLMFSVFCALKRAQKGEFQWESWNYFYYFFMKTNTSKEIYELFSEMKANKVLLFTKKSSASFALHIHLAKSIILKK